MKASLPNLRVSVLVPALAINAILIAGVPTSAQNLPDRPIRMVVPFSPAGFIDRVGRVIANEMSKTHPQRVYVENKPGAGGTIGAMEVAKADPDGTTLLMSSLPTLVLAPMIYPNPKFHPLKDLSHIAYIGGPPSAFVVSAKNTKIETFADLVRIATTKSLTYGTAGAGSVGHLSAVFVAKKAGLKLVHVPYTGPMLGDILSGVLDLGSLTASTVMGQVDAGKLRMLAVGTDKRLPNLPQVPTFSELSFNIDPRVWLTISGPHGMSPELQLTINKEISRILAQPAVVKVLERELIQPIPMSPAQVVAWIKQETATWQPIVQSLGLGH